MLKVKLLSPLGMVPRKSRAGDAGFDVFAAYSTTLDPGVTLAVQTDIAISFPSTYAMQVWARSGLALNHSIDVRGGLIDSGYRGEILILMRNEGSEPYSVKRGDRIAQLVPVQLAVEQEFQEVRVLDEPTEVENRRGERGFGSSGV